MTTYNTIHSGIGKLHLLDKNDKELCGSKGLLLWDWIPVKICGTDIFTKHYYEEEWKVIHGLDKKNLCKKCLKKAGIKL